MSNAIDGIVGISKLMSGHEWQSRFDLRYSGFLRFDCDEDKVRRGDRRGELVGRLVGGLRPLSTEIDVNDSESRWSRRAVGAV